MKKPLVLASLLLVLLAGCATQPKTTVRHGRTIKLDTPASQAGPVAKSTPVAAKPAAAPLAVKPAATAPQALAPAVSAPVAKPATAPVAKPVAAPVATVVSPAASAPTPPPAPVLAPANVQPPALPSVSAEKPLAANRAGALVQVAWTLPVSDIGYKAVEIMRNERAEAPGRTRVRAVRATVTNIQDTVPDAAADYWYWLKLTRTDGQIQNIGPVAAPKG